MVGKGGCLERAVPVPFAATLGVDLDWEAEHSGAHPSSFQHVPTCPSSPQYILAHPSMSQLILACISSSQYVPGCPS